MPATAAQLKKLRKKYGLGEFKKAKMKSVVRKTTTSSKSGTSAPRIRTMSGVVRRIAGISVLANDELLQQPQRPLERFGGVRLVEGTLS
jgi:hypothetical protein